MRYFFVLKVWCKFLASCWFQILIWRLDRVPFVKSFSFIIIYTNETRLFYFCYSYRVVSTYFCAFWLVNIQFCRLLTSYCFKNYVYWLSFWSIDPCESSLKMALLCFMLFTCNLFKFLFLYSHIALLFWGKFCITIFG